MAHVISDLSKYVIVFFMTLYTVLCIFAMFEKENDDRDMGWVYALQIISMFMVHFIGFAAICLETGDISYIIFYGFQQILLFATIALYRVIYPEVHRLIINNMCMLLTVGFLILTRISYEKSIKQFAIVTISLIVGLFIPYLVKKLRFLKHLTWIYGMLGLLLLVAVAVLGAVTHGAKISYSIAGVSFQPSEFVKILFVFFVAGMFKQSKTFLQVIITTTVAAVHVLTLVFSKDLGSALIFFVTYLVMLYIATRKIYYLLLGTGAGALAAFAAYQLFDHIRIRVLAWKQPWEHIADEGYQITQSLFAIGTGGWYGMGIYQGNPTAIPYVEQDFIFSAVAEELGVIFAICLIFICVSCFLTIMLIAMRLKEEFYRYIAVGIGMTYITQVFLTIGGGTRFIPLTGVTLPLVSYGGSSVLATIIMFCIVQGLYCVREQEGLRYVKKAKRRKTVRQEEDDEE